jgi:Protein of unknown function (DUF3106)
MIDSTRSSTRTAELWQRGAAFGRVGLRGFAVAALASFCVLASAAPESGPPWAELTATQKQVLTPLQGTWAGTDAARKKKWLEVAERFPAMPASERALVQQRMSAWAALSPAERTRARIQFQDTRQIGPDERQARWQAYQALPEAERTRLAEVQSQSQSQAAKPAARTAAAASAATLRASDAVGAKRNVVTAAAAPKVRAVSPTVVQAKPGATTTTLDQRTAQPLHHQPGLPKIVATPTFVDPTTMLPRRGPQAAAMRAASKDATSQP